MSVPLMPQYTTIIKLETMQILAYSIPKDANIRGIHMNKAAYNNKRKVWRKTYGKRFIARRLLRLVQMASTAAYASQQVAVIKGAGGDRSSKGLVVARLVIDTAEHMSIQSKLLNVGFATK
jgi:hypothetical protein